MSADNDIIQNFRSGIYLHYKKHLYEADRLTHNASESDRIEVHYIGLQLDGASPGPRHATRRLRHFLLDHVHYDGTTCNHTLPRDDTPSVCSADKLTVRRFQHLGPVFEPWMCDADPWNPTSR